MSYRQVNMATCDVCGAERETGSEGSLPEGWQVVTLYGRDLGRKELLVCEGGSRMDAAQAGKGLATCPDLAVALRRVLG